MPRPESAEQLTATESAFHQDELLRTDEVLTDTQLTDSGSRGDERLRVGVRFGRPRLYPVEAADLPPALSAPGARYLGALFAFDLDPAPAGHRYATARFTVDLENAGVTAVAVHAGAEQLGLLADGIASPLGDRTARAAPASLLDRLRTRDDRPPAWTTGVHSPRFGWRYHDRRGTPLLPRTYAVHAVLEVPAALAELSGAFEAELDLSGRVRRRLSATDRIRFTAPVPGPSLHKAAAVRLCMAADIVGYSGHGPDASARLQHDLVRILAEGRAAAGVTPGEVDPQPQGDGQFTVLPIGLDEAAAVPRLLRGIATALTARNATADDRMRLRLALHRGLVREADNGWVGRAATAVHRLLDSPPLRAAVVEHPAADYVLGVPDVLYADVLSTGDDPPPAAFRPVTVDLPAKGFQERSWIYVPEGAA
ncbi:hypothetical protein AB0J83_46930 [Actinoplanes sp. NPDC049596]|uniref:hypothetical protein n=1 Tax=unclassified Actinoplanes TaxID=2626549 RepID=UPI00344257BF